MKKVILISSIILVIVVLILIKIYKYSGEEQAVQKAAVSADVPADVLIVKDTTVEYKLSTIGTIRANESVEIRSEISRKLVGIKMKEGAYVTAGQILFKLDDEDISARLNKLAIEEKLAAATESREKIRLSKGGISQQTYDQVNTNLEAIRAEIKLLKVDLSKTEIKAPFNGKIGLRNVSLGSYINPNLLLANLYDDNKLKIDFSVPEKYSDDIKIGMVVEFSVDYSTEKYYGKVEAIEPQIDLKTRNLMIRAVADNRNGRLLSGSSVKINLDFKELNKSIFLPTESLIPSIEGYKVYKLTDGCATFVNVKTGLRTKEKIQITEGVNIGDTIVVTNILRLKPGTPVKINKIG